MAPQPAAPKTARIRVLRSFYWQGEAVAVGEEMEVPAVFAVELITAHKAEMIAPELGPRKPSAQQQADAERGGPETRFGPGGTPPASAEKKEKGEKK